jgi:hypothetical protein
VRAGFAVGEPFGAILGRLVAAGRVPLLFAASCIRKHDTKPEKTLRGRDVGSGGEWCAASSPACEGPDGTRVLHDARSAAEEVWQTGQTLHKHKHMA